MGAIKIGYTENEKTLKGRISTLQGASPIELVLIGLIHCERDGELVIHSHFADFRIRGEWFVPAQPIFSFINLNTGSFEPTEYKEAWTPDPQGSYLTCPRCSNDSLRYVDCNYGIQYYFSEVCEECGLWFDGKREEWLVDCENWETAWRCVEFEPPAMGRPRKEEVEQ